MPPKVSHPSVQFVIYAGRRMSVAEYKEYQLNEFLVTTEAWDLAGVI